ncbi:hypothetical protein [Shewanella colwelliana]|uniref:hypothetical protein n=1 Tax=Shewanella colwelliana TaxID=23 RepID=UPI00048BB0B8|nr:hypothetical protein [Shewanella colwelliana]
MINISNEVICTEDGIIKAVCTGQYSKEVCLGITNRVFGVDWWSMEGETSSVSGLTENLKDTDLLLIISDFSDESELNSCFMLNQIAGELGVLVMVFALNCNTQHLNSNCTRVSQLATTANIFIIEAELSIELSNEGNELSSQADNLQWSMKALIELFTKASFVGVDFADVKCAFNRKGLYQFYWASAYGHNATQVAHAHLSKLLQVESKEHKSVVVSVFCDLDYSLQDFHYISSEIGSTFSNDSYFVCAPIVNPQFSEKVVISACISA